MEADVHLDTYMKADDMLKDSERRNQELQKEIKALLRVQNDQSKALEKISNQNDTQIKLEGALSELKKAREKISLLEERRLREERTSKSQFEHMIKLEDKIKELKVQNAMLLNGG